LCFGGISRMLKMKCLSLSWAHNEASAFSIFHVVGARSNQVNLKFCPNQFFTSSNNSILLFIVIH
jgi:hypothetical protein